LTPAFVYSEPGGQIVVIVYQASRDTLGGTVACLVSGVAFVQKPQPARRGTSPLASRPGAPAPSLPGDCAVGRDGARGARAPFL